MKQLKAEYFRLRLSTLRYAAGLSPVLRLEIFSLGTFLLSFLLLGCLSASRLPGFPGAMMDEILFTDPAANLYLGHGFTSSAWFAQTQDKFWAGYPPLYSFLLSLWMHCVGFTLSASRTLNYLLGTTAGFVLWLALFRLRWIKLPIARITLVALFFMKLSDIFSSHTGRPDALAALISMTVLLTYSLQRSSLRYGLLIALGSLFPLTELQLIPYTVLLGGLLLLYFRKAILKEAIALAVGILLGALFLYGLYSAHGVWLDFVNSVRNNPSFKVDHNFIPRFTPSNWFAEGIYKDPLQKLLLMLLMCSAGDRLSKFQIRSRLSFGIAAGLVIPIGMMLASCYPIYYSWTVFLPVAIVLCAELGGPEKSSEDQLADRLVDRQERKGNILTRLRKPIVLCLISLCLIVYPLKLTSLLLNWKALDYAQIEALVNQNVKSSDWVLCHEASYYAAKQKAAVVVSTAYLRAISPQEAAKVSVLIINPESDWKIMSKLGGKWKLSGKKLQIKSNTLLGESKNFGQTQGSIKEKASRGSNLIL